MVISEMEAILTNPLMLQKKCGMLKKKSCQNNRNAIIAMCTAIPCKNRRRNMCLLQKIIALILQAGRQVKMKHYAFS